MSQFDGLLEVKRKVKTKVESPHQKKKKATPSPPPKQKKKDKKILGKSKNPDFVQTSIYVKKNTQISVKSALLTDEKNRDFSDLVEELLTDWIKKQN